MDVLRLELVCRDQDAATVVEIIERTARTGRRGDGLIAVIPVETVVRISTGERVTQRSDRTRVTNRRRKCGS